MVDDQRRMAVFELWILMGKIERGEERRPLPSEIADLLIRFGAAPRCNKESKFGTRGQKLSRLSS